MSSGEWEWKDRKSRWRLWTWKRPSFCSAYDAKQQAHVSSFSSAPSKPTTVVVAVANDEAADFYGPFDAFDQSQVEQLRIRSCRCPFSPVMPLLAGKIAGVVCLSCLSGRAGFTKERVPRGLDARGTAKISQRASPAWCL